VSRVDPTETTNETWIRLRASLECLLESCRSVLGAGLCEARVTRKPPRRIYLVIQAMLRTSDAKLAVPGLASYWRGSAHFGVSQPTCIPIESRGWDNAHADTLLVLATIHVCSCFAFCILIAHTVSRHVHASPTRSQSPVQAPDLPCWCKHVGCVLALYLRCNLSLATGCSRAATGAGLHLGAVCATRAFTHSRLDSSASNPWHALAGHGSAQSKLRTFIVREGCLDT